MGSLSERRGLAERYGLGAVYAQKAALMQELFVFATHRFDSLRRSLYFTPEIGARKSRAFVEDFEPMRALKLVLVCLATLWVAQPALGQRPPGLQPSEDVWQPADTPSGGISWALLESTEEIQRERYGLIYSKPNFPAPVKALEGKTIKVNGYMLPLENGARQSHFVLLAYPPDCPFHLNPAPDQFIEVRTSSPVSVSNGVVTIEGTLVLSGEDESGIFYQMTNARAAG